MGVGILCNGIFREYVWGYCYPTVSMGYVYMCFFFVLKSISQKDQQSITHACLRLLKKRGNFFVCKKNASTTAVKQVGFARDAELSYTNLFFCICEYVVCIAWMKNVQKNSIFSEYFVRNFAFFAIVGSVSGVGARICIFFFDWDGWGAVWVLETKSSANG